VTAHDEYFAYLRQRSRLGLLYRRFWLYGRLCRHLRGRVVDIGCGIGDMLRHRPDTIGVDVNPHTVEWCRKNGLDARLMEPDRLPFGDGEFDGGLLDNVLEHLDSPEPLLAEARRVLKSHASLIVGVPGRRGFASDPDHKKFYDSLELVALMKRAGFRCERIIRMPLALSLLDRHLRQYCVYGVFRRE
jgi:SAM-dependent methyltransferase